MEKTYQYVKGSAMNEIEKMKRRLCQLREFAELDQSDDLHLPLTSAQYDNLTEAIKLLEKVLNPV